MKESDRYWVPLKKQLVVTKVLNIVILVTTGCLLPIFEGFLVNKWTATPPSPNAGWSLFVVAFLHLILLFVIVAQQATAPALALAEAVELSEQVRGCKAEIDRRTESYRLVRSLFDIINDRKCATLALAEATDHAAEYRNGLEPIISKLRDNISVILGVSSNQFSIQVWLLDGFRSLTASPHQSSTLECEIARGNMPIQPIQPISISPSDIRHLPAYCFAAHTPFQKSIDNALEILGPKAGDQQCPYYKRFAFAHILRPCSEERAGLVLITSMQETSFATDVCDTLAFFASVIATYTNGFLDCINSQHKADAAIVISGVSNGTGVTLLDGEPAMNGTWSLYRYGEPGQYFGIGLVCTISDNNLKIERGAHQVTLNLAGPASSREATFSNADGITASVYSENGQLPTVNAARDGMGDF